MAQVDGNVRDGSRRLYHQPKSSPSRAAEMPNWFGMSMTSLSNSELLLSNTLLLVLLSMLLSRGLPDAEVFVLCSQCAVAEAAGTTQSDQCSMPAPPALPFAPTATLAQSRRALSGLLELVDRSGEFLEL